MINQGAIEKIVKTRKRYFPKGSRVRLLDLAEDGGYKETLPPGTEGTVEHIDALGTVHVRWDNGSRLGVLLEDQILRI